MSATGVSMNGSTQELSSVSPPDMENNIRKVGASHGSSNVPPAVNSSKKSVIGASRLTRPRSRASSAPAATKLLVIDAIGKTVSASGASPSSFATPNPRLWARPCGPTWP